MQDRRWTEDGDFVTGAKNWDESENERQTLRCLHSTAVGRVRHEERTGETAACEYFCAICRMITDLTCRVFSAMCHLVLDCGVVRIGPTFHFPARYYRRWLNRGFLLVLVREVFLCLFFCILDARVILFFFCYRLSVPSAIDCLDLQWPVKCQVGCKTVLTGLNCMSRPLFWTSWWQMSATNIFLFTLINSFVCHHVLLVICWCPVARLYFCLHFLWSGLVSH